MKLTNEELHNLVREVIQESHTKEQEEELKTIVGELEKASEMHASQAKRIKDIVDETDDDELKEENIEEGMNCGCGNTPCETYGNVTKNQLSVIIREEYQAVLNEKKKKTDKDKMKCNSPRRIREGEPGYGKKKFVVKACDGGKEKIIRYGDAGLKIKRTQKGRRSNFRARHKCATPGSKLKARYWSCKNW